MNSKKLTTAVFFGLKSCEVEKEIISSAWAHRNTKIEMSFMFGCWRKRKRLVGPDIYLPVGGSGVGRQLVFSPDLCLVYRGVGGCGVLLRA